jgi:Ca2+-binding EF-hand superfamily protein
MRLSCLPFCAVAAAAGAAKYQLVSAADNTNAVQTATTPSQSRIPVDYNVEDYLDEAKDIFKAICGEAGDQTSFTKEHFFRNAGVEANSEAANLVFERDDTNNDGKVSFDEFKRWFTRGNLFLQLDGALDNQRDGQVSREEFLVVWHGVPVEVFDADDLDSDGFVSREEFTGPLGAYGPLTNVFAQLDFNRDGKLTRTEFTVEWHEIDPTVFDNEDANGDDALSWDEFQGPKGSSVEEAIASPDRPPTDTNQLEENEDVINLFGMLDADMDGKISRAEYDVEWHTPPNENMFESEDVDKNGFLEWSEFNGPKGNVNPTEILNSDLFIVLDDDQNGVLSRDEFLHNKQHFSEEEQNTAMTEEDINGDNTISWEEFTGPKGDTPPNFDVFAFLDADTDNTVNIDEFMIEDNILATEEQFSIEDKDSDNLISWDEFSGPKGDENVQKEL